MTRLPLAVADIAAVVSASAATLSWIEQVNGILQIIATTVAIVAGLYAIRWHKIRINKEKQNGDKSK